MATNFIAGTTRLYGRKDDNGVQEVGTFQGWDDDGAALIRWDDADEDADVESTFFYDTQPGRVVGYRGVAVVSENQAECPWQVGDPITIFQEQYVGGTTRKDTTVARLTKTLVIDELGNRWQKSAWSPRDEQMRLHGSGYSSTTTHVLSPTSPRFAGFAARFLLTEGVSLVAVAAREWSRLDRKDRTPNAIRAYAETLELAAAKLRSAADGAES